MTEDLVNDNKDPDHRVILGQYNKNSDFGFPFARRQAGALAYWSSAVMLKQGFETCVCIPFADGSSRLASLPSVRCGTGLHGGLLIEAMVCCFFVIFLRLSWCSYSSAVITASKRRTQNLAQLAQTVIFSAVAAFGSSSSARAYPSVTSALAAVIAAAAAAGSAVVSTRAADVMGYALPVVVLAISLIGTDSSGELGYDIFTMTFSQRAAAATVIAVSLSTLVTCFLIFDDLAESVGVLFLLQRLQRFVQRRSTNTSTTLTPMGEAPSKAEPAVPGSDDRSLEVMVMQFRGVDMELCPLIVDRLYASIRVGHRSHIITFERSPGPAGTMHNPLDVSHEMPSDQRPAFLSF